MELVILKDIVIIFAFATAVNYLFTKIKIPTIIGYLLTGIVAGPYLLGFIESPHEIEFMAEIGIILLMFPIGLELSLNHLIKIPNLFFFRLFFERFLVVDKALGNSTHWVEMAMSINQSAGFKLFFQNKPVEFLTFVFEIASRIDNDAFAGFIKNNKGVFLNRIKCEFFYLNHSILFTIGRFTIYDF